MLNWFKSTLCESDEEKEFWLSQNMPPSCGHVGHTMVFSLSNAHLGETWSFSMRCSLKDWSLILWKSLLSGQQASSTKESFRAHIWTEGDSGFPPRPPALFCQYSPGGRIETHVIWQELLIACRRLPGGWFWSRRLILTTIDPVGGCKPVRGRR